MSIEEWPDEQVKEFRKGMDRLKTKFQRRQKRRNSLFGKALNRWITSLTILLAVTVMSGCASWHEPVSDFADHWGDKLGLDVEPPVDVPQAEIPVDEPAVEPAPEPQVDAPVASEPPQDGPKLPAKEYTGTITRNDALTWTLDNDPGGWDQIGVEVWEGKAWGGWVGADVVERNPAINQVKIKWSGIRNPMDGLVFVLIDNKTTSRPKKVWAKWIKEIM